MDEVTIVITGQKTGDTYYAKSYPDMDIDNNGKMELYKTPVYYAYIETHRNRNVWKCLRFMPYWNDPKKPYLKYKTLGWANAGLSSFPKTAVTNYFPNYGTQNMPSRFCGAIQIKGNFLIHAGPERISSIGWGAAGCVEIIGNFDDFKSDIAEATGKTTDSDAAIQSLVSEGKLYVEVKSAIRPNLKNELWKEIPFR